MGSDHKVERQVRVASPSSELPRVRQQIVRDVYSCIPATPLQRSSPALPIHLDVWIEHVDHLADRSLDVSRADGTHFDILAAPGSENDVPPIACVLN